MENQEILNVSIEDGAYIFFIKEKNSYFLRFNKAGGNSMLKILNQLSVDGYNFIRRGLTNIWYKIFDTFFFWQNQHCRRVYLRKRIHNANRN